MENKHIFTITEFADFARTTRDTLVHYDEISLLTPISRGENNYRYYSYTQLSTLNLIRTCQSLGMALAEIRELTTRRTPALMDGLLERQIKCIDEKISNWERSRKLLQVLRTAIHSTEDIKEGKITIQHLLGQPITLGKENDYSHGRDEYDALVDFYRDINAKYPGMDMNYSVWGIFSEERVKRHDLVWPDRYYFNDPDGSDQKPPALYAIGHMRGGYGQGEDLYKHIFDYIDDNGYEACGSAYEEYPLNEICELNSKNYLIRIMIMVCPKIK